MLRSLAHGVSPFDFWWWVAWTSVEAVLFGLACFRGLHRRLPVFTAYLAFVVMRELSMFLLNRSGLNAHALFYFFWGSQAALLSMRGLVVVELLYRVLRPYQGVWIFSRMALSLTAVTLLVYAGIRSGSNTERLAKAILAGERGLELAVVGTLLALLVICRYYGIHLEALPSAIALGLVIYSSSTIVNNTLHFASLSAYFPVWSFVRRTSYPVALLVWLRPLLRPLPEPAPQPVMAAPDLYPRLVPEFSGRMRALNDRLLDILQR